MENTKSHDIEFSEMESCIIILNYTASHLLNAVRIINDSIEKLNNHIILYSENIDPKGELKNAKIMISIAHEYLVLNLYNLLEIQPKLAKHLRELGHESLLIALKEVWEPIQKMKNRIKDWRDKYVAHAKIMLKNWKSIQILIKNTLNFQEKFLLLQ